MKNKLITLLVFTIFTNTYAQFGPQQILSNNSGGNDCHALAADIDGDGDMDVISSSHDGARIAWYENTDGLGSFGPQLIISTSATQVLSLYVEDLDDDGDMDVLYSTQYNLIEWHENDGDGNFGPSQFITDDPYIANSAHAADLDGDGDMDVLSASYNDNEIAWYENDGDGNFGPTQSITENAIDAVDVYAADIDGDGDMDVLSGADGGGGANVAWYENDGEGNFGPSQTITTDARFPVSVYAEDLDGDGDMDVLSASIFVLDNRVCWYENIDGQGNFGPQQTIATAEDQTEVYAADLDGDGDMDVLSSFWDGIAWYENTDGQGSFGPTQIITNDIIHGKHVYAEDLDGDGDMDVLSASGYDGKIAWYENLHPLSVNENALLDISFFPNPVKDVLNVISQNNNPIISLQVYDILGRLILEEKDDFNQIDVSNLDSGVLFVKIQTTEGEATKKIIKK